LCPFAKKANCPFTTVEETYELEYGSATVELHTDAVKPGNRVLLIDDLIATGGTMMAGKKAAGETRRHRYGRAQPLSTCPSSAAQPSCAKADCRCSHWWILPGIESVLTRQGERGLFQIAKLGPTQW
jgi:hypoxanthine phosphoribosyltransferase